MGHSKVVDEFSNTSTVQWNDRVQGRALNYTANMHVTETLVWLSRGL